MSTLHYYDQFGAKTPITNRELFELAKTGVITPETIIEMESGKRAKAKQVKGIVFGSDAPTNAVPPIGGFPPNAPTAANAFPNILNGGTQSSQGNAQPNANSFAGGSAGGARFCRNCGATLGANAAFCSICGTPVNPNAQRFGQGAQTNGAYPGAPPYQNYGASYSGAGMRLGKDKTTAGILALVLGGIGVHKFYLGSWGFGLLYILCCWTGIPSIVGLVEGILYLTMPEEEFQRKYSTATESAFRW